MMSYSRNKPGILMILYMAFLAPGAMVSRLLYRRHQPGGEISKADLAFFWLVGLICMRVIYLGFSSRLF